MSSKKNKSKSKKASEGDSSLLLKEASNDSSDLQTSSHEGGSCRSLNNNSFTVIDFIDKGKNLLHEPWTFNRLLTRWTVVSYADMFIKRTDLRWKTWPPRSLLHSLMLLDAVRTAPPVLCLHQDVHPHCLWLTNHLDIFQSYILQIWDKQLIKTRSSALRCVSNNININEACMHDVWYRHQHKRSFFLFFQWKLIAKMTLTCDSINRSICQHNHNMISFLHIIQPYFF